MKILLINEHLIYKYIVSLSIDWATKDLHVIRKIYMGGYLTNKIWIFIYIQTLKSFLSMCDLWNIYVNKVSWFLGLKYLSSSHFAHHWTSVLSDFHLWLFVYFIITYFFGLSFFWNLWILSSLFVFIAVVKHTIKTGFGHLIVQDKNSFTANLRFFLLF